MDLFKPPWPAPERGRAGARAEYNILKTAGSSLGFKHSEETLKKLRNRKHSEETKAKMSDTAKKIDHSGRYKSGENHPNYGKPKTEGSGNPSQAIEVTDIKNNITTSYDSILKASIALNISFQAISIYFIRNQQKPYKGRYTFKKL
jgi:group I intron endonuclease